jgi:hypothetical protein
MNAILVVVDKFSKFSHFLPLSHPFTALTVAKVFFSEVYRLHGMPMTIISDRDRIFTSNLWKELFKLTGVTLSMSFAYHPQTNGQIERVNQCLETFLRCFVHSCPSQWIHWLPLAEYWYNTCYNSAVGRTPFEILYGQTPRKFGIQDNDSCTVTDLAEWMEQRHLMENVISQHLLHAQQRMKSQADKKRSERTFQIGEMVYLKLQPYVQASLAPRANMKLSFKFFGPYKIIDKISATAYKLQLPTSASIHLVFHVSLLKKVVSSTTQVTEVLPDELVAFQVPEELLRYRETTGNNAVPEVLVKW